MPHICGQLRIRSIAASVSFLHISNPWLKVSPVRQQNLARQAVRRVVQSNRRFGNWVLMAAATGKDTPHHKHTNRLAKEQSPYLLQHAHNPVDWFPWGEEAFEKAQKEDKPVFLSVGYATCHWCHVMERESFENEEVAKVMNELFINVKVDREERPDVDKVYMTFVQAFSGSGGWPMNVFLTPDLQPFYGGTYYPPKDIHQGGRLVMPGFVSLLERVAQAWQAKKEEIKASAVSDMESLQSMSVRAAEPSGEGAAGQTDAAAPLEKCAQQLGQRFDKLLGGFGGAPKFPRPSEINALLRAHLARKAAGDEPGAESALHMASFTLERMAAGGMHDHLAGGFHRYSVDEHWHVPHFEKMLYDNPQLASTYLEAFQLTGDRRFARVARDILDYLMRDMTHPEGGVFSAEDADSFDPGKGHKTEGAFYLWSTQELREVLGEERSKVFEEHYGCQPGGNCNRSRRSDPHGEFAGLNVLYEAQTVGATASRHGMTVEACEQLLASCRAELDEVRRRRPRPDLDDKVVTAWNGMAISAFAVASRALAAEDPPAAALYPVAGRRPAEYRQAAERAAAFIRSRLMLEDGRLLRSYRTGPSPTEGFADDYAHMVAGLLDLYETSGSLEPLRCAVQLQSMQDALFWDPRSGGYFQTSGTDPSIKMRMKEDYDGAEPAASSVAASNLVRLAALLPGGAAGREASAKAPACVAAFQDMLREAPMALPAMCCSAYLSSRQPLRQVIIAGAAGAPDTEALLDAVHAPFTPDRAVIIVDPSDAAALDFWRLHNPEAVAMVEAHFQGSQGPATAFICQNYTCQAPTTDPARVRALMTQAQGPPTLKQVKI